VNRDTPERKYNLNDFRDNLSEIGRAFAVKQFWGLPLFIVLFAITFTLFVLLVSIFEALGADILPFAGVFIFLSAIFWIIDPLLKEKLPTFAANVVLIAIYLLFAQLLLIASGGLESPLFVVYSFVVFTGAFSYGLTGSFIVTLVIAAAYATFIETADELPGYFIKIITLWIVALMVGFLAEMKRRVERRETLQNMRLTALSEVAKFMREMSKPKDVIEAGLDALLRLLDTKYAVFIEAGKEVYSVGDKSLLSKTTAEIRFPFDVSTYGTENSKSISHEIVLQRLGKKYSNDEERIARLLIDKMFLIWKHLEDRAIIDNVREEKERVLDSIGTAVVTLSDDAEFTTLNRRAMNMLSADSYEIIGKRAVDLPFLFPEPSTFGEISREVEVKSVSGETIPVEMKVIRATEENGKESGWIVVMDDLKEIRRLSAMMRRSEALAAVGEMAAKVAHEIRNPLGGILGFLGLAEHKASGDILRYIRQSKKAVMRLEALVRDLLTYAKPLPREHGRFLLAEIWSSIEQTERAKSSSENVYPPSNVESLSPKLLDVHLKGEPLLFGQVIDNLVRNAKEAADANGHTAMRARDGDPFVWIEIDDDGPGWSDHNSDSLFEPFYSTKETGSGLGLAIAKRIVEQIGGSIKPMRDESNGKPITRFRIAWPKV